MVARVTIKRNMSETWPRTLEMAGRLLRFKPWLTWMSLGLTLQTLLVTTPPQVLGLWRWGMVSLWGKKGSDFQPESIPCILRVSTMLSWMKRVQHSSLLPTSLAGEACVSLWHYPSRQVSGKVYLTTYLTISKIVAKRLHKTKRLPGKKAHTTFSYLFP